MISFKSEFYPDGFTEQGEAKGPKVITLSFKSHSLYRYKEMNASEKAEAIKVIEEFQDKLAIFKERFENTSSPVQY